MAPRDPIPLRLPQDDDSEAGAPGDQLAGGQQRPGLDPFRRGPEITEVR
jgi:hypothetical protein